ncbi:hypothetical protein QZH41_002113 [Actinostola sp. cb2023]|nr:hypothetical protein QZH41_002113 [Actinostola sp. cb2023]
MYAIRESDDQATHKEATPTRIKRDEGDVQKIMDCFTSGLMTDPFTQELDAVINFATGLVCPHDIADALISSTEKGREQMTTFVEKRINSNAVSFWDPIPNLKVKTFSTLTRKLQVKAADEKLITVNADRDLFGRLLIAANFRQINLKDVLSYELSAVPCSLAHQDGSLRKTTKSILCSIMENDINVIPRLPETLRETTYIIDGMALVQMTKSGGATTFGELALKYYSIITAPISLNTCNEVHVVFDQYWDVSIKAGERLRRGASAALEVHISGPSTPVPRQRGKYITNSQNKVNLCDFLTVSLCKIGKERLTDPQQLVIGGGTKDGERAVRITHNHCEDVAALKSNHEEADTRMLLHAKHASHAGSSRIVIQSPDTDVLVLCAAHFDSLACEELWLKTGVKDRLRFIPVHDVSHALGRRMCDALPAFHALTGCDSTSALAGIGKKKAWRVLQSNIHQESLSLLGQHEDLDSVTAAKCEEFICDLYPVTTKKPPGTTDNLRYLVFCQKKQKNELLPPTSDCLSQHLNRANYQAFVWRRSLDAMQELPSPEGHGWLNAYAASIENNLSANDNS